MLVLSIEGGLRGESNKGAWPKRTTVELNFLDWEEEKSITDKVDHLLDIQIDQYPERTYQTRLNPSCKSCGFFLSSRS